MMSIAPPTTEKLARDMEMARELVALATRMGADGPHGRLQVFAEIAIAVFSGLRVALGRERADQLFATILATAHESADMHPAQAPGEVH